MYEDGHVAITIAREMTRAYSDVNTNSGPTIGTPRLPTYSDVFVLNTRGVPIGGKRLTSL